MYQLVMTQIKLPVNQVLSWLLSVNNLNWWISTDTELLLTMFVFVVNRLDAAMERERLLALQKEKAKEEAKKRYMYVCSKIQYHKIV